MATDGASCEPDFSRAPEDAAGATAEAAVTEVPGWAREGRRRGPGFRLDRACTLGRSASPGSQGSSLPGAPSPRGSAAQARVGAGEAAAWAPDPFCPFPALREAVPVRPVLGTLRVRPERPLRPLSRGRRGLAGGGGRGVFLGELDPHCSPLAARVVGASVSGLPGISQRTLEGSSGVTGRRQAGVGIPIVCVRVCACSCARGPLREARRLAVGAAAPAARRSFGF